MTHYKKHAPAGPLMVAVAILLLLVVALAGCPKWEWGPPQTERGVVKSLVFIPSGHGSGISPGMSMNGSIVITATNINIPARWAIVFQCEHGSFVVEGAKWKELWARLKEGQEVEIQYRQQFRVSDDGTKTAVRLDFLGAK